MLMKSLSLGLGIFGKIFDGDILIILLLTTVLQMFCKIIFNFKVIVKSLKDPDDNFTSNSKALNG